MVSMEAQFLQSQNERLRTLQQHCRRSEESSSRAAEAALEQQWSAWRPRLEALERAPLPSTEDDRRQLRLQFHALQDMIHQQRYRVSCSHDLTDVSLRRWHSVLVSGQGQLDQLQTKLLPKGKFVFQRYRRAMEAQRNENSSIMENIIDETVTVKDDSHLPSELVVDTEDLVDALQDFKDGTLHINESKVTFEDKNEISSQTSRKVLEDNAIPLVWRRLERCTIHWMVANHSSTNSNHGGVLHLVNLTDCELRIHAALSSIHVTDCQGLSLHLSQVQQVRLHTSSNIKVLGRVRGGTILEECRHIAVTSNCPSVQDFSWLIAGKPSPNLERVSEPTAAMSHTTCGQTSQASPIVSQAGFSGPLDSKTPEADDSDDDEL